MSVQHNPPRPCGYPTRTRCHLGFGISHGHLRILRNGGCNSEIPGDVFSDTLLARSLPFPNRFRLRPPPHVRKAFAQFRSVYYLPGGYFFGVARVAMAWETATGAAVSDLLDDRRDYLLFYGQMGAKIV